MLILLLSNSYCSTHKAIAIFGDGLMLILLLSNSYCSTHKAIAIFGNGLIYYCPIVMTLHTKRSLSLVMA
ncbi:MAG: hypothetical protein F6K24_05650 [Okeania sp. SIO2D1]|nr:hypothetical protein [Okeania sp. SIO2D1]